jgi:predicted dehydrogenase
MFLALASIAVAESSVHMSQRRPDSIIISIALLGAGIFAREAHLPAILKNPSFDLKAIYSRTLESAKALAKTVSEDVQAYDESSLDELLARDDISAVVISLPILAQPDIIRRAWKAGKSVISEKPIAQNIATALELIQEHEEHYPDLLWLVAEQWGYEPAVRKASQFVRSLGKIRHFGMFSWRAEHHSTQVG